MVTAAEDSVVRVAVRVRPPTPRELESLRPPVIQVLDDQRLVFDPEEPAGGLPALPWGAPHSGPKKKGKGLTFVFDRVFGEGATQQTVFQHTAHGVLDSFLQGYNCSVFAYGATGAGKTHTMLGQDGDPGIMYLTTVELYRRLEALRGEKRFEVLVSYLEVYNEQIHDLLEPKGPLSVREDSSKGVVVQGLSFHQPASAEQLLEMLSQGNRSRTQHPTDANATSSRSHAIFQVSMRRQDCVPGPVQTLHVAKMSLIDLAGSERASSTRARGERLREGANINRSLLALISVLNALADAKGRRVHVPYRDSKLTRLLKDSLGGNCHTVMIANVSPSGLAYEDTYNTLKYADRAKEIRLTLKSSTVTVDSHISHCAAVCQQLQAEVAALRKKLQEFEARARAPSRSISPPSPPCTPGLPAESGPRQVQPPGAGDRELPAAEGSSADPVQPQRGRSRGPAKVPAQVPELNPRRSVSGTPSPILPPSPASQPPLLHRAREDRSGRLVLRVLRLAQQQYVLLQAAGLLTPDLTAELETLQRLVQAGDTGPRAESCRPGSLAGAAPPAQELHSAPRSPGCHGPTTRTMARQQSGIAHSLGALPGPDATPAAAPRRPPEKRKLSPTELDSALSPRQEPKRQRQPSLPSPRRGLRPEPHTPTGAQASPACRPARLCPTTVIKRRAPLAPSALQNRSSPLAPATQDLNTTFDLSVEPPPVLSFQEQTEPSQPFVSRRPAFLLTGRNPKPASSLPSVSACRRRRPASSSVSRGHSRIACLPSSSLKRPAGALAIPEPLGRLETQEKPARARGPLLSEDRVAQVL